MAKEQGWSNLTLRTGFNAEMAERHSAQAKLAAMTSTDNELILDIPDLPETMTLYYDDTFQQNFEASVLASIPITSNYAKSMATHAIILDRTCFYPEGGGQEGDYGKLISESSAHTVIDTKKLGNLVVHISTGPFEIGDIVQGMIDWDRRKQLMDHHTSVHIVGGAARKLLGPHIYQAGSNKSADSSRLDITHHRRLTRKDLDQIESIANEVVQNVQRIEKLTLNRKDADRKFGFDLYQGGAPKLSLIHI